MNFPLRTAFAVSHKFCEFSHLFLNILWYKKFYIAHNYKTQEQIQAQEILCTCNKLALLMYNAHPYFSLKNLGKKVCIINSKILYLNWNAHTSSTVSFWHKNCIPWKSLVLLTTHHHINAFPWDILLYAVEVFCAFITTNWMHFVIQNNFTKLYSSETGL